LDKGEITEQGSHDELLASRGLYYRLWEMQQGNWTVEEQPGSAPDPDEHDEDAMSYV
jgi:ATP-binding cassette subfamily B protein